LTYLAPYLMHLSPAVRRALSKVMGPSASGEEKGGRGGRKGRMDLIFEGQTLGKNEIEVLLKARGADLVFVCACKYICIFCSVVQCGAVWCSVVQCGAVWCSVVQCVMCVAVCCIVL